MSQPHAQTNGKVSPYTPKPTEWDLRWNEVTDDWYRIAPAARRWLLRDSRREGAGVFPLGKAGQLIAGGGVGKTMLLVSLARAVATGAAWLDTFACSEPGLVLMLLGEEDVEEARRRCYNDARGRKTPDDGSIVVVSLAGVACAMLETDANGNPTETAFVAWLRSRIGDRDWRLIIIDPQSRFAGLDAEKDNALATRFVQLCESFVTPTCSVLVAHHTPQTARGKGAVEEPRGRGVTALHDGFRWQAALVSEVVEVEDADDADRLGEIVTLKSTKSNYSRKFKPVLLRRDDHGALLPMNDDDVELVKKSRDGTSKSRQRAEVRAGVVRERNEADDAVVRELIDADPEISKRALRATVKLRRGCGTDRADDAIARVRGDE